MPAIRISALFCNGGPAAVEVSLECKGHQVAYLISYDVDLAQHGVGIIVAEDSIRTAHARGEMQRRAALQRLIDGGAIDVAHRGGYAVA